MFKEIHTGNDRIISLKDLDNHALGQISLSIENGRLPTLQFTKTDLNQGRIFATQSELEIEKFVRTQINKDGLLPIVVAVRRRVSKKNPSKYRYDVIVLNGHHRTAHAFAERRVVEAQVVEVFDETKTPQSFSIRDLCSFSQIQRAFFYLSKD